MVSYTSVPAAQGQDQFDVLVFTQDDPYHRDNIPAGMRAFEEMSRIHHFGFTWTMDADVFTTDQMKEFDGGRSFYSALGHHPELYDDERYREFIFGGVFWAATGKGE